MEVSPTIENTSPRLVPRGAWGIVKETFRLYGHCIVQMTVITAAVTVPLVLAGTAILGPEYASLLNVSPWSASMQPPDALLGTLAAYASLHLLGMMAAGSATMGVGAGRLTDSTVSISGAYGITVRHLPAMIGAGLIVALVVGIPTLLIFSLPTTFTITGVVLLAPMAMLAMYLVVRLMFVGYAAVLEQAGALAAVERSWKLISGGWRRTFRLAVLLSLCLFAVQLAFELTIGTGSAAGAILATVVVAPLGITGNLLIYLDLRARKEAFTGAQLMEELQALDNVE